MKSATRRPRCEQQEVEAAVDKTLREINTSADPELLDLETKRQLRELFRPEPDA